VTQAGALDIGRCVFSGQVFRWDVLPDGSLAGADGFDWYVVSAPERRANKDVFRVESNAPPHSFESLFRLDWDAEAVFREIVARGPELEPYLRREPGLRVMRPGMAREAFFGFLCTPNNHMVRIRQMIRHLAARAPRLETGGRFQAHGWPSIDQIASIPEEELRRDGFGYRAATIPAIARQVLALGGEPWIESLRAAGFDEARGALMSLKGVGPKLADCICLFALDLTEALPVDTHIWQAATRLYFPEWEGKAVTTQRYEAVGALFRERFGKLAGWAQQALFYDNLLRNRGRQGDPARPDSSRLSD
jgi:N-glycosylase/DNA lyase